MCERTRIASLAWYLAQQSYWLGAVCYDAHADGCFYYGGAMFLEKREVKSSESES